MSSGPSGDKLSTLHYFFTLAMQMQTVAVSWEIYQRLHMNTRDAALALGLIGLVQVLPMMIFALPGANSLEVDSKAKAALDPKFTPVKGDVFTLHTFTPGPASKE